MNSAARTRGLLLGRLLCAIVVLLAAKAITAAVLGPYNAYVDRIYACAPGDSNSTEEIVNFIEVSKYDIRKQHILQRVTGNVTVSIKEGINNAMWAKARLDSRVHAHWADNAFTFSFDKACEQGRTHMPGVWSTFFKLDPTVNPCRVPPAIYRMDNEPINWTFPKFPIMPHGSWTFHLTVGQGKNTVLCNNVDIRSVAKQRPGTR